MKLRVSRHCHNKNTFTFNFHVHQQGRMLDCSPPPDHHQCPSQCIPCCEVRIRLPGGVSAGHWFKPCTPEAYDGRLTTKSTDTFQESSDVRSSSSRQQLLRTTCYLPSGCGTCNFAMWQPGSLWRRRAQYGTVNDWSSKKVMLAQELDYAVMS